MPHSTPHRQSTTLATVLVVAALVYGLTLWPTLVEQLASLARHSDRETIGFLRSVAARLTLVTAAAAALIARGSWRLGSRVPQSSARDLAKLRVLTSVVLLISVLWEDLPSLAQLPPQTRHPHGLSALLYWLPGYESLSHSASGLAALQLATGGALLATMLGFRTRASAALSAGLYFAFAGLLREPTWPYHTGLVPAYLMLVLALSPCADAYSVDSLHSDGARTADERMRRRTGYGWGTFAWFSVLTLPYVEAGLSKLANAGFFWWDPTNMRAILYADSLSPMQFDFDLGLRLAAAPDGFFALLGIAGMFGEIAMGLVFFSKAARRILPAMMISMHLGIWLLQNILFFDLILLLLAFYGVKWPSLLIEPTRRRRPERKRPLSHVPRWLLATFAVLLLSWTFAVELFPFTAMQMYAKRRDSRIEYHRLLAEVDGGGVQSVDAGALIPALRDGRYRRYLRNCFEADPSDCEGFLTALDAQLRSSNRGRGLRALRVERREWDFAQAPDDPDYGRTVQTHRFGGS